MPHCKICGEAVRPKHTIQGVTYFYCPACHFLQNYFWEEKGPTPQTSTEQTMTNDEARQRLWPAGEAEHMRQKGWEMLELMSSPFAWFSRNMHHLLKQLPLYSPLTRYQAHQKLPRLLDFGCGHGITVLELKREGFNIVGVDPYSPTDDASILRQELLDIHFPDNSFDGIFTIETMEHITNVLEVFTELKRSLRPGGVLLVQTRRLEDPNYQHSQEKWFYLQEPKTHVSIYSEPAFRHIAKKVGFASVSFRGAKFAKFIK